MVGRKTLELALSSDIISNVIAPTRKPLPTSEKLVNLVGADIQALVPALMSHKPDAVICALGTTRKAAGSKEAFRHVDYDLPLALGRAAYAAGVQTYAIVTAKGASSGSRSFYYRTKGEVEKAVREIGFRSLTICRPSLIDGSRNEVRGAEHAALMLLRFLAPVLPEQFRVNPAEAIAAALLDAVVVANTGCRLINSQEMN